MTFDILPFAITILVALKAWYSAGKTSQIKKTFENADTNNNGKISINEAYDLVLQIYLEINRDAPVDPPTRKEVEELFIASDANSNGNIEFDEFKRLVMILMSRAETSLVMYKVLSMVVAPLLSWKVVNVVSSTLQYSKWPQELLSNHEALLTTLLTTLFIGQLGNTVLWASTTSVDFVFSTKKKV